MSISPSSSSHQWDHELEYLLLLITCMVCADQQIHSEEAKGLKKLAQQVGANRQTLEEMEKILAQDEQQISIEKIANNISYKQRQEAFKQILAIAYIDGFCSPLERELIRYVAQIWNFSPEAVRLELAKAENFAKSADKDEDKQEMLSFGARFLQGMDSVFSRAVMDSLIDIAPKNIGQRVEQLRQEILLAGPEYDAAIQQCAAVAREDYEYAKRALDETYKALHNLGTNIRTTVTEIEQKIINKGQATTAKEVAEQLKNSRCSLTAEIIKEIGNVRESLHAKQRALNYFSIAFMGKTKAGKSTLHAIITNEGWEAIGVGKQRTTRFNRHYEWKNIRIIDTPGIGAPGGKTDEEIARSVIDESDIICYVVTNDSIQETEFGFLKVLKEKAKPLIILLNIKHNLRDSRRLEHFLSNPDKLFALDGKSGLGGHIERIRRYAKQHYANDYFSILPVMLLAAQLSREAAYQQKKEQLFKASRVQDFLNAVQISLVNHGAIRRSQTLLGSTVGMIDTPCKWVTEQGQAYTNLTAILKTKRGELQQESQKAQKDTSKYLQQRIKYIFQSASNIVSSFAEEYWSASESAMKQGWEKKLKDMRFEERINAACQEASQKFGKEMQEAIEEIGSELQLVTQLGGNDFDFKEQDSSIFDKDFLRIGRNILGVAASVLFFVPGLQPVSFVLGIAAGFSSLLDRFFKSKNQKRREAVLNISSSLTDQIEKQKEHILQQAENIFNEYCNSIVEAVDTYFEELIRGLGTIAE